MASSGQGGSEAAPSDSVQIDGVTYDRVSYEENVAIADRLVDRQNLVSRVEAQVSSYDLEDGQATVLAPGTPLYAVKGYDVSFRLAAREGSSGSDDKTDRAWSLYEVWSNPGAENTAELLDVRGKVERISLKVFGTPEDKASAKQVSSAIGAEESEEITNAVVNARLRRVSGAGFNWLLVFHLKDGTQSARVYEPRSGELYLSGDLNENDSYVYTGVALPKEYRQLLRPTLRN